MRTAVHNKDLLELRLWFVLKIGVFCCDLLEVHGGAIDLCPFWVTCVGLAFLPTFGFDYKIEPLRAVVLFADICPIGIVWSERCVDGEGRRQLGADQNLFHFIQLKGIRFFNGG